MSVSHLAPGYRAASADLVAVENLSIGQYLIRRLQDYGIADVFGIPGDYVLGFYSMLCDSPINVVGCCREDNAGFAADAYARLHGMGCVCVTYCVGGLSLANSIAGAYAEKSPVIVISGAPGMGERLNNPALHHKVRDFRTQLEVFEKLCVAATELTDPNTAFRDIDRVLDAAARFKRPGYIELPRDMVKVVPKMPHEYRNMVVSSDPSALAEAAGEACELLNASKRPVIIAGVEIHRFGLQDELVALAESAQLPVSATILGKSVISELHPLYVGLYEGAMGHEEVTRFVEESDCVLMLGEMMSDINMGIYTAKIDPANCIFATSEELRIRHHHYHDVALGDFMRELRERKPHPPRRSLPPKRSDGVGSYTLKANEPIKIMRMIGRLNQSLDDQTIVISDIGDALFSSTELTTHGRTEYVCPAYYTSMGFATPAALGTGFARPGMRTVAIVGDGAFQMTGNELSTIVRHGFHTIVILLDNKGYGTERFLHPGDYNDIHPWNYHKIPQVLGGGRGYEVRTEGEFDKALSEAWKPGSGMSLIQVHLSEDDASTPLKRLAERLSKRV